VDYCDALSIFLSEVSEILIERGATVSLRLLRRCRPQLTCLRMQPGNHAKEAARDPLDEDYRFRSSSASFDTL
jgi:hypothetical protein